MAPSARPTTAQLAESIAVIEQRTEDLLAHLEAMQATSSEETNRIWTVLGSIAGLDGLAVGMAEVAGLLAPLRQLVPPSTALPLEPGVAGALITIREALGGRRETNFPHVPTEWDNTAVGFIGQADPSLDPDYETGEPGRQEQVA